MAYASGVIPQFLKLLILPLVLSFFAASPLPVFAAEVTLPEIQNLVRQKKYDQALEKVDAYLAPRPKDAQGRFIKGLILTELDRPNDAIAVFTQLTRDYPTLPEPYNNLAVLYAQQKQYDKARVALEMAIKTHPSYATAHENLGDVYAKLASQAYNKALQLDAGNTTAQSKLALIHDLEDTAGRNPAPTVLAAAPQAVPQTVPQAAQSPTASRTPTVPTTPVAPAVPPAKTLPATSPPPSPLPPAASAVPAKTPPVAQKSAAGTTTTAVSPTPATTVATVVTPSAGGTASTATPAAQTAATTTQPAATSTATPPAAQKQNNTETELVQAAQRWASAWSKKDVKAYLATYAPDFATPKGTTRKEWEAERTRRIDKPGKIEVALSNIQVSINGDKARVKFRQRYKSATLASSTGKTLIFTRNGNQWLIQEERVD